MAGLFVLLGVVSILWHRKEKKMYYNSIVLSRKDVKEFMTHEPERPWLGAWQLGGRIFVILGVCLAIAGGILWVVGR